MENEYRSKWLKLGGYVIIFSFIVLASALFAIRYSAGILVLLGVFLAQPIKFLVFRIYRSPGWHGVIYILITLILVVGFGGLFFLRNAAPPNGRFCVPGEVSYNLVVKEYNAILEPENSKQNNFRTMEQVIYSIEELKCLPEGIGKYEKTIVEENIEKIYPQILIQSDKQGLLTRGINTLPLQGNNVTIGAPDGTLLIDPLCDSDFTCASGTITLRNMPKGSFFGADNAEDIKTNPGLNTDSISWTSANPGREIAFAYIQPPFHPLSGILSPFLGISSTSDFLVVFITMIITALVFPAIKS